VIPKEAYPFWRWNMWLKGYGTYEGIDRQVNEGKLIPFKDYPSRLPNKPTEPNAENGDSSVTLERK